MLITRGDRSDGARRIMATPSACGCAAPCTPSRGSGGAVDRPWLGPAAMVHLFVTAWTIGCARRGVNRASARHGRTGASRLLPVQQLGDLDEIAAGIVQH